MDGDCFFHAVCDQLERLNLPPVSASQLRERVANSLSNLAPADPLYGHAAPSYVSSLQTSGTWADSICAQATARFLNRDIVVISMDDSSSATFPRDTVNINSNQQMPQNECILLGYYDNHFVSLQVLHLNAVFDGVAEVSDMTTRPTTQRQHRTHRCCQKCVFCHAVHRPCHI